MKVVVKVGGSLAIGDSGPKKEYFQKLVPVLNRLKNSNQLIVCIGGGRLARNYMKNAADFGLKREEMEWAAIEIIRANVRLLASLLKMRPIFSIEEIGPDTSGVIGGVEPGRSTDANAAYAAWKIGADFFIKLTDVNGIHDRDPKKHEDATRHERISFDELEKHGKDGQPGDYGILDKTAMEVITSRRIKTMVIEGSDPEIIFKALAGENIGTLIDG